MARKRKPTHSTHRTEPVAPPAGRRVVPASEFKAHCLRILDEVAAGAEVVITKRGEKIAVVGPARRPAGTSRGSWKGLVEVKGDIVHVDWSGEFEAAKT